ncbi:3-oxoacyl-[acyl-carrier protein] reductase [Marinococcus luteus]|uniref:3-oxoacyl-[acyl-carrier protein] reductase n=1 Tax=Marinococcus luteus TaxID=1122204 RepID=A0A1H2X8W9_9BACI|nr:SDR family oxidoreductase [Marinococcus luteus]SDW89372.1 3-oxoacyl-[acyl-carrier protein] reductase [Marinococcus luteus]
MSKAFEGKKVLITGGSKGIGKGIAQAFYSEGARVGILARSEEGLKAAKEEIGDIETYACDVTVDGERQNTFQRFIETFGGIDILVNNAGGSSGGKIADTSMEEFTKSMETNYFQAVHFSKMAYEQMRERGGAVINITSIFGKEAGGKATYNNAKAALISFTKAAGNEWIKDGVRVNSIAPGSILHPTGNWQKRIEENPEAMERFVEQNIPAGRFGNVEEVADAALFLASQEARWLVGTTLTADGGQSRMNI